MGSTEGLHIDRLDDTAFGDYQRRYLQASITCLSSGGGRSMTTDEWRESIEEIAAVHRARFTVDAWISAGTQELWLEYLERVHGEAMADFEDRLRFVFVDRDELTAHARAELEV